MANVVDIVVFPSRFVNDVAGIVNEHECMVLGIVVDVSLVDFEWVPAEKGIKALCGENEDCLYSRLFDVMTIMIGRNRDYAALSYWWSNAAKSADVLDNIIKKLMVDKAPSSPIKITMTFITNPITASKG